MGGFMMKRIAIAVVLALVGFGSLAAAQGRAPAERPVRPGHARFGGLRLLMTQGVRKGLITPEELGALRSSAKALRGKVHALRQNGARLTPQQRQEVRQDLQRLTRKIVAARRNGIRRGGRGGF